MKIRVAPTSFKDSQLDEDREHPLDRPLRFWQAELLGVCSVIAFHLAHLPGMVGALVLFYMGLWMCAMRWPRAGRYALYGGILFGLGLYVPQLSFFWTIFGIGAIALWLVLAVFVGLFFMLVRTINVVYGMGWAAILAPFLWTGLEYFRSELYYLKFSWITTGYAVAHEENMAWLLAPGAYGFGFILMAVVTAVFSAWRRPVVAVASVGLGVGLFFGLNAFNASLPVAEPRLLRVAGMQMEFPVIKQVIRSLDALVKAYPDAELLVLSEYTLDGAPPDLLKKWCKQTQRYLVLGGKEPVPEGGFYDMAYVIDPEGNVVFRQGKSVPIQFFNDGRPAEKQEVWNSPWGKLGICICYDLSYTRVVDRLVRQGAEALIVPTMDLESWGLYQHKLHARVAPTRAAEAGIPIFRVASSGFSQLVDRHGKVLAEAPVPGEDAMIAGVLELRGAGRVPPDRWLCWACAAIALVAFCVLGLRLWDNRFRGAMMEDDIEDVKR